MGVVYTSYSTGTNDSIQRAYLQVELDKITDDPANNRSYVRLRARFGDNSASYGGTGTASWNVYFDGALITGNSFGYNLTGNSGNVYNFYDGYFWVTHSADGTRSVTGYAEIQPFNSFILFFNVSGPITLTNYDRSPVFSIETAPTPVIRGTSYTSSQFTASNTSSYTQTGSLPPGLTFNTSTGALTGTPDTAGSYEFTITANGTFEGSASVTKTVVVNPPAPAFTDSIIATTANLGSAYSDSVSASDAGYGITAPTTAYSIFSGNLPDGLTLDTSTGDITGTPTTPGVFNFVIRAANLTGTADTDTLTITALSGGKVWNGTAFVAGTTRVWDGTAFASSTTKVWDGSEWVSAS